MVAFLVIVLGAHLAIRFWAPYADPLLLPIATVLNGLGIVMIYRLNQVGRDGNPGNGGPISTLGSQRHDHADHLLGDRRHRPGAVPQVHQGHQGPAAATPTSSAWRAWSSSALPALLPVEHQRRGRDQRQDPDQHRRVLRPAGGVRQAAAGRVLRQLPGGSTARSCRSSPRSGGSSACRGGADLAPILVVWALSMLLLVFEGDIGTSAVFMGLFVAMLYIATGRRSWAILGFLMFLVGAFAAGTLVSHVRQRFIVLAPPVQLPRTSSRHPALLPDRAGPVRDGQRRAARQGARRRPAVLDPAACRATSIFTAFGEETRPGRRDGAAAALRPVRAARPADRHARQGRVLQAARQRAVPSCSRSRSS